MGDNVKIVNGVRFITHDGGVHVLRNLKKEYKNIDLFGKIVIKNNVFIGLNSIILPGVTIGSNVIIGAGSIVTKSIPDNTIVAGNPAKIIGNIEQFENRRKQQFLFTKYMGYEEKKKTVQQENEKMIKKDQYER